ncbi:hypothetical protein SAMN05216308_11421 [Nitrosospira sp. Nsp13]|jgi:hypothetical protein|nr:hypothetical protein SAMN05216308_11421 [Nitrosospira sp. Nsp13]
MDKKIFVNHSAKLKKSTAGFRVMKHGRNFETAMIQEYQNTARLYQDTDSAVPQHHIWKSIIAGFNCMHSITPQFLHFLYAR